MVAESQAKSVVEFLVTTGSASPMDIGVCVLNHRDGSRAWKILNDLVDEGYVVKTAYATYRGRKGIAATQKELWT